MKGIRRGATTVLLGDGPPIRRRRRRRQQKQRGWNKAHVRCITMYNDRRNHVFCWMGMKMYNNRMA